MQELENLNQTAHDCPDCGDMLLADDSDIEDVIFVCPNCDSEFYGQVKGYDGNYRFTYIVQGRV